MLFCFVAICTAADPATSFCAFLSALLFFFYAKRSAAFVVEWANNDAKSSNPKRLDNKNYEAYYLSALLFVFGPFFSHFLLLLFASCLSLALLGTQKSTWKYDKVCR